jgi:hypothetical protein
MSKKHRITVKACITPASLLYQAAETAEVQPQPADGLNP